MALLIQSRISEVFAVDIHPGAKIGHGIVLDHATGIVIGETSVVGDNVTILHNVTLGGTRKVSGDRHPKIGEGVLIGAGAKILGNVMIGAGANIGAGSVVLKEVPCERSADEKRSLERELARVKVSSNWVATVVANEWKDENDKAEMQRLRDKLAILERTAKTEAQLKPRGSTTGRISPLQQPNGENISKIMQQLQKEVIALIKLCEVKDSNLNCKDEEITMLVKKVEKLMKREKREATPNEKEGKLARADRNMKIR
ncbi:hypothetical protein ACFE04_010731 [Oxalis oulophora]